MREEGGEGQKLEDWKRKREKNDGYEEEEKKGKLERRERFKLREKSMPLHTVQSERGGPLRRGASEGYLSGWWRAIVGECHLLVVLLTR